MINNWTESIELKNKTEQTKVLVELIRITLLIYIPLIINYNNRTIEL